MIKTALKILKVIEENDFEAYIVGGCVRDYLMNKSSIDVDICTNATPKDLKAIFKKIILPKKKYGSVRLIVNNIHFEITTFRKEDNYLNHRVPVDVSYIDNLLPDLERRDFTINTLCMDKSGKIIDLLGGRKDLNKKLIRMVGDPKIRLKEDILRILRAVRFATILNFELESSLKKYIIEYGMLLSKLSYYRKKEELDKIFSSPNAKRGIELLIDLGLDKQLELNNLNNIVITDNLIGIWAQLDVSDNYNFQSNEMDYIIRIRELLKLSVLDNHNLYKYGLYDSTIVGQIKSIKRKEITKQYNKLQIKSRADIDINTNEICEIVNKKPGKFLKTIVNDIEYQIIDNKLKNKKSDIIKYIKSTYID